MSMRYPFIFFMMLPLALAACGISSYPAYLATASAGSASTGSDQTWVKASALRILVLRPSPDGQELAQAFSVQAPMNARFLVQAYAPPLWGVPRLLVYQQDGMDGTHELHCQLRIAPGTPATTGQAAVVATSTLDGLPPGSWKLIDDDDGSLAGQFRIVQDGVTIY